MNERSHDTIRTCRVFRFDHEPRRQNLSIGSHRTIGTSTKFVFSIPAKYTDADAFARYLIADLGLHLSPSEDDRTVWRGRHLGMALDFTSDHKKYDEPVYVNDGQRIDFASHRSSIELTGRGFVCDAIVPMMLNIAIAICYWDETDGYLLDDGGDLLVHLEWNPSKSLFWNIRKGVPFNPTQLRGMYRAQ